MTGMRLTVPTTTKAAIVRAYDSLTKKDVAPSRREAALKACYYAAEHGRRGNRITNADRLIAGGITIRDVLVASGFTDGLS